ncbi:hypothetical protein [Paenibacillus sp. 481]|uniref:hypothetical protein n=1 Tax=Paenibacillus sp. 481 TaxID=2835869 RepID=UPI001E356D50|nr:hypothetical protein [Paenibacillus sp. 481]UHA72170.1 hypothetical protein KIK04_15865 [Paenibacillus sp. 481]
MLSIKNYIVSNISSKNIISQLMETINSVGYVLPIEEAKKTFQLELGIPHVEHDDNNTNRHMFEFNYLRRRLLSVNEYTWNSFFRFNNVNYCILKVGEESEEDSKKAKNTKFSIDICFILIDNDFDEIDRILGCFKKRIPSIKQWEEYRRISKTFDELSKTYTAPLFSKEEYYIANSLYDPSLLNILMSIKSSGGLLRRDVLTKFERILDINLFIEKLIDLKLLRSEYVVLCKKTSEQINKAPVKESINLMGEHGIRCSRCNRLITDETVEEYLAVTDTANGMLDGSKWMTINLVETLINLGISEQDILVNITQGPEEIDAIVSIGDEIVLFELKDSQFSLGHAYAFQSRLGIYEAETGVIWATKGVAPEVKEHFNKVKPDAEICYIENIVSLVPSLVTIIEKITWAILERELSSLSSTGIIILNIPGGIIEDIKIKKKTNQESIDLKVAASIEG